MQLVHEWADLASVLGLFVALVGFAVTIFGVFRSKSAAEAAQRAALDVRQKLTLQVAVFDLNRVLTDVDELKLLHRAAVWEALPARYASLRRQLLTVKMMYPNLSKGQKTSIQGIIQQFSTIEQIVEAALAEKRSPPDVANLNKIAADQGDKLNAILIAVQQMIGA